MNEEKSSREQLDGKGFVFMDSTRCRAYNVRMIDGQPWLCYWNDGYKCFTTLRPVTQSEIFQFAKYALSDDLAKCYFKNETGG